MNGQPDACQELKNELDRVESDIRLLRQQLLRANPSEKPAIVAKIHNLELDQQLTSAAFVQCRDRNPILDKIFCDPFAAIIPLGVVQQFTAVGSFLGHVPHGQEDLTTSVTWKSSHMNVATISTKGQATGVSQGTTTITATLGSIIGTATLRVGLASIEVRPSHALIAFPGSASGGGLDVFQQFKAFGTFADGSPPSDVTASVTWASFRDGRATISNSVGSQGRATGVSAGPTIITANTRNAGLVVSGTATLNVQ